MNDEELTRRIDAYINAHWEDVVADIDDLVRIPSVEELDKAAENAPFGPGPRAALTAALDKAAAMGLATHDVDGYLGFADLPGETDTQIGIIGHVDVVPAGPGWTFEPYAVTRREGFLLGRGVIDDKGPSVVALHAVKFWKELQDEGAAARFPYTIRFMFGVNEETGMGDVAYYRQRYADPAFLFTPDAEFPVCYGEKGCYDADIASKPIPAADRTVIELVGGAATNAVPGQAHALVRADADALPSAERITVSQVEPGLVRIEAAGKSAHASLPEGGVNAIGLVVRYLLDNDLCSPDERAYFELTSKLVSCSDGSGLGIACSDEYFGALTAVGGIARMEGGRFVQTLDARYPTSTTGEALEARLQELAGTVGATAATTRNEVPFLTKPDSPVIQALLSAYNEATGEQAEPFTMGGGTYARHFTRGASFGPEKPWETYPEWVGQMHGPDEGVSEELLKQAFKIYALTIGKLMELDLR